MEDIQLVGVHSHRGRSRKSAVSTVIGALLIPVGVVSGWLYLRSLPKEQRQEVVASVEKQAEAVLGVAPDASSPPPAANPPQVTSAPQPVHQTAPASSQRPAEDSPAVDLPPVVKAPKSPEDSTASSPAPTVLSSEVKLLPIVRLDLDRKESVAQRAHLDLPELTSEERESLRLDLKLSGVDSVYAEGAAGLTGRQPSVFRIDGKVPFEIEVRLGRDGEKNILLIKTFSLLKPDGAKREKQVPMSLAYARSLSAKAKKRHEASEKVVYNMNMRLNEIKREDGRIEKEIDELNARMRVEVSNRGSSPQLSAKYDSLYNPIAKSRDVMAAEKATIEARLPAAIEEVQKHLADMKLYDPIVKDLESIEKSATLSFRAFALKYDELSPIAETGDK